MSSASLPLVDSVKDTVTASEQKDLLCPSAQAEWEGAKAFGVVLGTVTEPRVAYFAQPLPLSLELVESTSPVSPAEVLRIAAPCATSQCQHFESGQCQLISRTVDYLDPVTEKLPRCAIRASCRWWHEHGKEACYRCPQVVTNSFSGDEKVVFAATPTSKQ
jgi:hypothetical protein